MKQKQFKMNKNGLNVDKLKSQKVSQVLDLISKFTIR